MRQPPMCYNCKHQSAADPFKCSAFPGGIPPRILANELDHRQPVDGDGGVRYEAIDSTVPVPPIGPADPRVIE